MNAKKKLADWTQNKGMSDAANEIYSDEELGIAGCLREATDNLNCVSSDSASTFEYVEKH